MSLVIYQGIPGTDTIEKEEKSIVNDKKTIQSSNVNKNIINQQSKSNSIFDFSNMTLEDFQRKVDYKLISRSCKHQRISNALDKKLNQKH